MIPLALPNPQLTARIGELRRHGRREASTLPPPALPPQPAVRLIVTPETGGKISKNGFGHLYAVAVDAAGRVVPGVDINFSSSAPLTVAVAEVTTDNRTDLVRALLTSGSTIASVNITVSSAGLPSIVVPVAVQTTMYGALSGGKPVGLWMSDVVRTAEAAAQYAADRGHTGLYHQVQPGTADRWYFLALLQAAQNLGLRVIAQFFAGTTGVLGSDGQFSVAAWTTTFGTFPAAALTPFIPNTLVVHHLLGYPKAARWGRIITPAELKTMAATSKAALPTLPVIVGGEPARDITGTGYSSSDVDYAFPIFSYGKGPGLAKCRAWLDRMKAESIAAGLGGVDGKFYCGLDLGDGGSGSPSTDPPGWRVRGEAEPGRFAMSPDEITGYGTELGNHGSVLSVICDSYNAQAEVRLFARTDFQQSVRDLAGVYARTAGGDPQAKLSAPMATRVQDLVEFVTLGSGVPAGLPAGAEWVRFLDPGDGKPLYGPLFPGAPDPVHTYAAAGDYTATLWVVRLDTGQMASASAAITVANAPVIGGGLYTDTNPLPAIGVPTPARYAAYLSLHGHKVYYLTDGHTLAAHQTALSITSDRLFFVAPDGVPKFADVSYTVERAAVVNTRSAFTSVHGGRGDSGIWSRPLSNILYTLASGATGKLLQVNCDTLEATVLKDFFADSRFRTAFGTQDRALSHLHSHGLGLGPPGDKFAATVIVHSTSLPVGVVVWEPASDGLWFYKPPNACAEVVPELVRLDASGRYLKIGLRVPVAGRGTCPTENDTSWQAMDLQTSAVGEWIRDGHSPEGDDTVDNLTLAVNGEGVKRWQIFPPQSPATVVYQLPRLNNAGNDYMVGSVSSRRASQEIPEIAIGFTLGAAGLVGPWESLGGNVYRTKWQNELNAKVYRWRPQVVRRGYEDLREVATLQGIATNQWFFDGTYLYVHLPAGTAPQLSGPEELQAFDWRFGTEEILLINFASGSLIGRLCHHHHRRRTNDPARPLAAAASYDGQLVTFTTNAGGGPGTRVYAVCVAPGANVAPSTPPP